MLCAVFLYLQFGFATFWQKDIGTKAPRKILMKLTAELNNYKAWICISVPLCSGNIAVHCCPM